MGAANLATNFSFLRTPPSLHPRSSLKFLARRGLTSFTDWYSPVVRFRERKNILAEGRRRRGKKRRKKKKNSNNRTRKGGEKWRVREEGKRGGIRR